MSDTKKVPLHEATPAELRYFASTILGIADVKPQHRADTLLAKISAVDPNITEIEVPTDIRDVPGPAPVEVTLSPGESADETHFSNDPRVEVEFGASADPTKPKSIQLAVNGDVVIAKRQRPVRLPYRHFLACLNAIETIGRETGEENAQGLPEMEFADQFSYPLQVLQMPPRAQIMAWHEREKSRPPVFVQKLLDRQAA